MDPQTRSLKLPRRYRSGRAVSAVCTWPFRIVPHAFKPYNPAGFNDDTACWDRIGSYETLSLFNPNYVNFQHPPGYHPFVVSPDGQRFLILLARTEQIEDTPSRIAVVQSWAAARER